jgi:hypothetical protein
MFRALLAHPQKALHKRHLVYCVRIKSVGCGMVTVKPCLRVRVSQTSTYSNGITHQNHTQTMAVRGSCAPDDGCK